ncbi:MAG: hypothetical protein ACM30G_01165 [Micromonosporaceae bacterium]
MAPLECQYLLLMRAYPRQYRQRRGEEMLATLLDSARPDQRRASWRDVTDLLGGAARERLGLHAVPGAADGLRLVGPMALVLTAGQATVDWTFRWVQLGQAALAWSDVVDITLALAWVTALLVRAVFPGTGVAPATLAWLGTVVLSATAGPWPDRVGAAWGIGPHALMCVCGFVAMVGTGHRAGAAERVGIITGSAAFLMPVAFCLVPMTNGRGDDPIPTALQVLYPAWNLMFWVVPVGLALAGAALLIWRRDSRGLWAALIMLMVLPMQLPWVYFAWPAPLEALVQARLLPYVLVLVLAVTFAVAVSIRSAPHQAPLRRCGALCLGLAAGIATATVTFEIGGDVYTTNAHVIPMVAVAALFLVAALAGHRLPVGVTRGLTGAAVLAALAVSRVSQLPNQIDLTAALVVLGLVAMATAPRRRAVGATVLGVVLTGYATYGLALSLPSGGIPFSPWIQCAESTYGSTLVVCDLRDWAMQMAPLVALAGLIPTLIVAAAAMLNQAGAAPIVVAQRESDGVGATGFAAQPGLGPPTVAFAAALLLCLLVLSPVRQPLTLAAVTGSSVALLLATRAVLAWLRYATRTSAS